MSHHTAECAECARTFERDRLQTCERCGRALCEDCWEEPAWQSRDTPGEKLCWYRGHRQAL